MIISLFDYLLNKKPITIYTFDNKYWHGIIVFLWFDHLVLHTDNSRLVIPYTRIDYVTEDDYWANRNKLENAFNKTEQ